MLTLSCWQWVDGGVWGIILIFDHLLPPAMSLRTVAEQKQTWYCVWIRTSDQDHRGKQVQLIAIGKMQTKTFFAAINLAKVLK